MQFAVRTLGKCPRNTNANCDFRRFDSGKLFGVSLLRLNLRYKVVIYVRSANNLLKPGLTPVRGPTNVQLSPGLMILERIVGFSAYQLNPTVLMSDLTLSSSQKKSIRKDVAFSKVVCVPTKTFKLIAYILQLWLLEHGWTMDSSRGLDLVVISLLTM